MNDATFFQRCNPRSLYFCILTSAFCLLLSACSRGPQTADELLERLPRRYGGELRVQGETGTRILHVELLDLKVRDTHTLEFGRVAYQVDGGSEGTLKGESPVLGSIMAPGGKIDIEDAGNGDALKPGSFEGQVSTDLQSVDAKWKTGYDQSVNFSGKAAH